MDEKERDKHWVKFAIGLRGDRKRKLKQQINSEPPSDMDHFICNCISKMNDVDVMIHALIPVSDDIGSEMFNVLVGSLQDSKQTATKLIEIYKPREKKSKKGE